MSRTKTVPDAGDGAADERAAASPSPADVRSEAGVAQPPAGATEIVPPDEQWAEHLRSTVPALFMHTSMIKPFKDVNPNAYKIYRERLLADSGNPQDPVEVLLLDQLALANFDVGLLHCRAANAPYVADAGVYAQAAARLMAECRRTSLALLAYRAGSRQLAAGPKDDIVLPDGTADHEGAPGENSCADKKGSPSRENDGDRPIIPISRAASV